jgi:AcrR family transcriptional regulator
MTSPPEQPDESGRRAVRTPQQARSRRTRQRVLDAAVACFEAHGYDETTTAMIAAQAGVAVGTVYGYFQDKRDILLELFDVFVRADSDEIIRRLAPSAWHDTDPRAWTRSLIDTVFHTQGLRPGIQRIIWERYFKDDAFRAVFDEIRGQLRVAIDGFIDAVDALGLCRPLVDRELASFVILNAVQWNASQALWSGDSDQIDHAAHATAELIERYIFVDPASG